MSGYKVRIWCDDCTGQDEYGCYDGRPWWHISDPTNDEQDESDARVFATEAEAQEVVDNLDAPWSGEIVAVSE